MHVLDENITEDQAGLLRVWRIHFEQVAEGLGRVGMTDEDVIPLLHKLRSVTFFTRDVDYYKKKLCHASKSHGHAIASDQYCTRSLISAPLHGAAQQNRQHPDQLCEHAVPVFVLHATHHWRNLVERAEAGGPIGHG